MGSKPLAAVLLTTCDGFETRPQCSSGWEQTEEATAADNAGLIRVMCCRMKADVLRVKLEVVISGFVLL